MATENLYPYTTTIRSIIEEQIDNVGEANILQDATVIMGVANKGPKYAATLPAGVDITSQFGDEVGGERSLVAAWRQFRGMVTDPSSVRLVRVGKTTRPTLELYEFATGLGVHAPHYDVLDGTKTLALGFIGPEDQVAGTVKVEIVGDGYSADTSGVVAGCPSKIIVSNALTNQVLYQRAIDPYGLVTGARKSVKEVIDDLLLLDEFNPANVGQPGWLGVVYTQTIPEERTLTAENSGSFVKTVYDAKTQLSGGGANFIATVSSVYSEKAVTETIDALGTVELDFLPVKDTVSNNPTISEFKFIVRNENVEPKVGVAKVGQMATSFRSAVLDQYWVKVSGIISPVVRLVRGNVTTTLTLTTDYTIDVDGNINFTGGGVLAAGFQLNDEIYADYKYEIAMEESKVRSNLRKNDPYNYFVIGRQIIFGAAPARDMEIAYTSRIDYTVGSDVVIGRDTNTGKDDQIIFFPSALATLDAGDVVTFVFETFPELPAPTGYTFTDNTVQKEGMTNGDDGTNMSLREYKKEIEKVLQLTEAFPAREIFVAGAYLDDTVQDFNPETGLLESRNIGWHTLLESNSRYKSEYVGEVQYTIPIRPPVAGDSITMKSWFDRAVFTSANDVNRAANIMSTIADYHGRFPAGSAVLGVEIINPGLAALATIINNRNAQSRLDSLIGASLPVGVNPIPGYDIVSMAQKNELSRMRYMAMGFDDNRYVLIDHPSGAREGSNLQWQNTVENVFDALRIVRRVMKGFIGKRMTEDNLRIAKNQVLSSLGGFLVEPKRFLAIDATIQAKPGERLKGTSQVLMSFIDAVTMRNVEITTRVTKG